MKNSNLASKSGTRIKQRPNLSTIDGSANRRTSEPYIHNTISGNSYREGSKPRAQTKLGLLPSVKSGGLIQHIVAMNHGGGKRRIQPKKIEGAQRYSSMLPTPNRERMPH